MVLDADMPIGIRRTPLYLQDVVHIKPMCTVLANEFTVDYPQAQTRYFPRKAVNSSATVAALQKVSCFLYGGLFMSDV